MSKDKQDDEEDYLSPKDMRQWAQQEIKDTTKALELRVRDLTDLVTAYAAGELTPEQADEQQSRYQRRWGEALYGATVGDGVPDDQILARIDAARGRFATPPAGRREQHRRILRTPCDSDQSR